MSNAGKIFVEDIKDFMQDRIIKEIVKKVKNKYPLTNHEFCLVVDTAELSCQAIAKEIFDELERVGVSKNADTGEITGHYFFEPDEWKELKQKFVNNEKEVMDKDSLESAKQSHANSQIKYR